MKLSNVKGVSLPIALWLGTNEYNLVPRPNVISVTSLLRSPKSVILGARVEAEEGVITDVMSMFASRLGTALHSSIENAWIDDKNRNEVLKQLGVPKRVRERIVVNKENPTEDEIGVWLELRTERQVGNWILSGEADMILDGAVHDFKSTGLYQYETGCNDKKYMQQMSLYRWLNPKKITKDVGYIEFLIKDWSALQASIKYSYPQTPVIQKGFKLMSLGEAEKFIFDRVIILDKYKDSPQDDLPDCTPDELWMNPPKFQYFVNASSKKATKNFDDEIEAKNHMLFKGKGVVKKKLSKAVACNYCSAFSQCKQRMQLQQDGLL